MSVLLLRWKIAISVFGRPPQGKSQQILVLTACGIESRNNGPDLPKTHLFLGLFCGDWISGPVFGLKDSGRTPTARDQLACEPIARNGLCIRAIFIGRIRVLKNSRI
jgi:hypothetical protein